MPKGAKHFFGALQHFCFGFAWVIFLQYKNSSYNTSKMQQIFLNAA